eukprot:g2999.t1
MSNVTSDNVPSAKRAKIEGKGESESSNGVGIVAKSSLVLYSYWRSSCSYRVRIALNLKGLSYQYIPIHLVKDGGQQLQSPYATAINPSKQVPTLIHKTTLNKEYTLTQSMAICEYLDEAFPSTLQLINSGNSHQNGPMNRATIRRVCEIINSGIQPVQNLAVLRKAMAVGGGDTDAQTKTKIQWGQWSIGAGFDALEPVLAQTSGSSQRFCVGECVTLADCFLVPQVYNARRFKLDMTKYPTISKITTNLEGMDAFRKAHPSEMPDAQ